MTKSEEGGRHDLARCGGRLRQGEGTCTQPAGWGTDHPGTGRCKLHGGSTPTHREAAVRVEAQALVRRLLADPDAPPVDNPAAELSRIVGVMGTAVDVLGGMVNDLMVRDAQGVSRLEYADVNQVRRMNVLFEAWTALMVEYRKALTDMVRLGIEAHQARISTEQGMQLVAVLRGVLDGMLDGVVEALGGDAAAVGRVRGRWPGLVAAVVPAQIEAVTGATGG